jgi:hypothetical protein
MFPAALGHESLSVHYVADITMWNDIDLPLAYLITFRCHGTWLHGDERSSTDRRHNIYRTPHIPVNEKWERHNRQALRSEAPTLDARQRQSVANAIRETCLYRRWHLLALGVRTNHVHVVVSIGTTKPSRALMLLRRTPRDKCEKTETGIVLAVPGPTKGASAICGMNVA